jgi:phosphatidate cytidylyltransferase
LIWLEPKKDAFSRWAWTLAGTVYIGGLLAHLVGLRGMEDGRNWVFFVFLTTFASDTAAFLWGRSMGRHKLAPKISPAKTWEGSLAGVAGAVLIGMIFVPLQFGQLSNPLHIPRLGPASGALLALTVSVFGQFGDLAESLLKRNMEAKDSGRLLPGHGGALDRLDSVVFAGVVVYYYVVWLMR